MSYCLCRLGKEKKPQGEIQAQHRPTEGTGVWSDLGHEQVWGVGKQMGLAPERPGWAVLARRKG